MNCDRASSRLGRKRQGGGGTKADTARPDDLFVLAIDAVWRPLECIKNKVTVRTTACVCVCPGAVHTLLLLPKSMNRDRQRQRHRKRQKRQRRLTISDRGVCCVQQGEGSRRQRGQLSVPGQDMKRVRKFATIRMLHATCAVLPLRLLQLSKQ